MMTPVIVPTAHGRARASRILTGALRRAGATSEATSVPLLPQGRAEEAQLRRLIHLGAVKQGRRGYWLDEERYREIRHARWRILAIVLLLEAAFIATMVLYLPHHPR
jgi:hypothetical protein